MKNWIAVILETGLIAGGVLVGHQVKAVPYNIRELFAGRHPLALTLVFLMVFNFSFGFPVVLGQVLNRCRKWRDGLIFPAGVLLGGVTVFFLLFFNIPRESLHDVVGSPILGWPWEFEILGRFVLLYTCFCVLWTGASLVADLTGSGRVRGNMGLVHWAVYAPFLLLISYLVVVKCAATDNLTELLENGGGPVSVLAFGLWVLTIGFIPSLLCPKVVAHKFSIWLLLTAVIGSVPLGYFLIDWALVNDLCKYGKCFSGLQFLLSPDRDHYVSGLNLALRYGTLHLGLTFMMALCQFPFWNLLASRANTRS